jgi:hypothetical protein
VPVGLGHQPYHVWVGLGRQLAGQVDGLGLFDVGALGIGRMLHLNLRV